MTGSRVENSLYRLCATTKNPTEPNEESSTALYGVGNGSTKASLELWHRRFGHLNCQDILKINKSKAVHGLHLKDVKNHSYAKVASLENSTVASSQPDPAARKISATWSTPMSGVHYTCQLLKAIASSSSSKTTTAVIQWSNSWRRKMKLARISWNWQKW